MGEGIKESQAKILSVSLVLYNNDIEEVTIALNCALESKLVGVIYLIDNSPTNNLKSLKKINENKINYLFQSKNLGFGKAHNIGIQQAHKDHYQYHLILNPDIEFKPGTLEGLYEYMQTDIDCGLVSPKIFYKNGDLQYLCKRLPTIFELFGKRLPFKWLQKKINYRLELHHFCYNKILNTPSLSGCFMFCRMDAFSRVGLFDDRFFMYVEDLDLSRRFHKLYKTIFYPHVEIIHGYRGESRVNKKLLLTLIISALKYFYKYGWVFDSERVNINKELENNIKNLEVKK